MNYLQLCQRAHQEIHGGHDGTAFPTAVTSQTGEALRVVTWVAQAWTDIQDSQTFWLWMYKTGTLNTSAGTAEYTISSSIADFRQVWPFVSAERDPYIWAHKSSVGATDQQPVFLVPWTEFNGFYNRGNFNTQGRPRWCAISPTKKIHLFPVPDDTYVLTIPYRKTNQTLSANTDTPEMPDNFHMLIVDVAQMYYGGSNTSNRVLDFYGAGIGDDSRPKSPAYARYKQLCNEQLPSFSFMGSY